MGCSRVYPGVEFFQGRNMLNHTGFLQLSQQQMSQALEPPMAVNMANPDPPRVEDMLPAGWADWFDAAFEGWWL